MAGFDGFPILSVFITVLHHQREECIYLTEKGNLYIAYNNNKNQLQITIKMTKQLNPIDSTISKIQFHVEWNNSALVYIFRNFYAKSSGSRNLNRKKPFFFLTLIQWMRKSLKKITKRINYYVRLTCTVTNNSYIVHQLHYTDQWRIHKFS